MTHLERKLLHGGLIIGAVLVTAACALILGLVLIGVFS